MPAQHDGGTGGSGGKGGDAGMDTKTDADAKTDLGEAGDGAKDLGEAGDVNGDRPDLGEAGDTGEVARACYAISFDQPKDLAMLSAADDKDADQCANGFQYDVKISSTDAPNGTVVNLLANNVMLAMATFSAGKATFTGVQLASSGDTALSVQFPSTMPCTAASTKAKVTVSCKVPNCTISKPSHTTLNGIPVAQGGDRVSSGGSPYQVAFEVTTDVDDGRPVALKIDNTTAPATVSTVMGTAMGGKATFSGVTLTPDGKYEVVAQCTDKNSVVGSSTKVTFTVDTTPPDLTISTPQNGAFFGPADLTNGAFKVCGKTAAADAVAVPPGAGTLANNFCIAGTNNCVAVATVNTDACVNVACPGGAPFDINVNLNDAAGNVTTNTITHVSCSSTLPSVRIVAPVSDAPAFADVSKRLLAAGALGANQLKDLDGNTAGAQANVTACSDRAGMAQLLVGHTGDATLNALGSAVATAAAGVGECPAGFGFVAKFNGVTLPQSTESAAGGITAATELRVDLTDVSTAKGSSALVDIWVDTIAPVVSLMSPANLCGSFQQTAGTFTSDVKLNSDTATVTLTVTNGASTDTRMNPTFAGGVATFTAVNFDQGQNSVAATATDAAGNATTLAPAPCTVTVGGAPVVAFTTPIMTQMLCANGSAVANCIADNDAGTTGWQGSITAHVTVGGVPLGSTNVTFTIGAATLGTALLDVNGNATLAITTNVVPEGPAVTFTATTDNVAAHGAGVGTVTVNVDTLPPAAPTNLTATVLDRRQTSFQLSWTAPADAGGAAVVGYQVRYAKVLINAGNFDDSTMTTAVTYGGTPAAPGAADGIVVSNLYIENGYFFAVEALDAAGNRSGLLATNVAVTAHFNVTTIPSFTTTDNLGFSVNGEGDVNGDNIADLLIGTFGAGKAYLYLGATGATYAPAAPSVTFTGASADFGATVAQIGDIDKDGMPDVAIADAFMTNKVYIYKGRTVWPAALTDLQADYVIGGDATFNGSTLGVSLARLGDFNGDGTDDLAIGARGFNTFVGKVIIVLGRANFASVTLPDIVNTITIDGDATLGRPFFGAAIVGLGHFYNSTTGTTLIVGSPGTASSATANAGRVYAFHGQTGTNGVIALNTADQEIIGPGSPAQIGLALSNLGPLTGTFNNVGVGNPLDNQDFPGKNGTGFLLSGTPSTGPLTNRVTISESQSTLVAPFVLGGGVSGRDISLSLIGDSRPDVLLGAENGTFFGIMDGTKVPVPPASVDFTTTADVNVALPAGWGLGVNGGTLIPDINGDQKVDFAIRKANANGAVAIYY